MAERSKGYLLHQILLKFKHPVFLGKDKGKTVFYFIQIQERENAEFITLPIDKF